MGDVIKFPGKSVQPELSAPPGTVDEVLKIAEGNKRTYVEEIAGAIWEEVALKCAMAGIKIESEDLRRDSLLVYEAIKSLLLKGMGVSHTLQTVAARIVKLPEEVNQAISEAIEESETPQE